MEEAHEVNEQEIVEKVTVHTNKKARNIHKSIFLNNFDVEPVVIKSDMVYQTSVVGFSQCVMYLCKQFFFNECTISHL